MRENLLMNRFIETTALLKMVVNSRACDNKGQIALMGKIRKQLTINGLLLDKKNLDDLKSFYINTCNYCKIDIDCG